MTNPLRAGKLRHKVSLQSATVAKDSYGGESLSYSTYSTVWASIVQANEQGASENDDGNRTHSASVFDITIRYNSSITTGHYVLFGSRRFDINQINNMDANNVYQVLRCSETN